MFNALAWEVTTMTDTMTKSRDGKVNWGLVKAASEARKARAATPQAIDERSGADNLWLTARQTAKLLGKSTRTLSRWEADPEVGLPPPARIKGWRYYNFNKLKAFMERRTTGKDR
jgi:hypothetical protein